MFLATGRRLVLLAVLVRLAPASILAVAVAVLEVLATAPMGAKASSFPSQDKRCGMRLAVLLNMARAAAASAVSQSEGMGQTTSISELLWLTQVLAVRVDRAEMAGRMLIRHRERVQMVLPFCAICFRDLSPRR